MTIMTVGHYPTKYAGLIRTFELRPVRTEAELEAATRIVDALAVRDDLTKDQEDYLYVLTELVSQYESRHHAIAKTRKDPVETLRFLLQENGMTGSDLGRLLGARQLGSLILSGKRKLSKSHIKKLSERFAVDASLFLD